MSEPTITINPETSGVSPSEEIIAKAKKEVVVTDTAGHVIALKKPGVLAQFRLVEILGASAKNEVYMNMILPIIFVTSIDGQPVLPFSTKLQVEALISQLGDEGVDAVMTAVSQNFGAVDPEADKAALKN